MLKSKQRPASPERRFIFKGTPKFENLKNVPTLIVLDDLIHCAYSKKAIELFAKGLHLRNFSFDLIIQNIFHQGPSWRDISLNSKYLLVFRTLETRQNFYTWPTSLS